MHTLSQHSYIFPLPQYGSIHFLPPYWRSSAVPSED
ncbi:hypothetical protein EVA_13019 [gut metagenome]|uniref:Uncharacterized protein n=1 Tax=gut metagenome TaxID=749906 RepID=J9GAS0_9ZZZZ